MPWDAHWDSRVFAAALAALWRAVTCSLLATSWVQASRSCFGGPLMCLTAEAAPCTICSRVCTWLVPCTAKF